MNRKVFLAMLVAVLTANSVQAQISNWTVPAYTDGMLVTKGRKVYPLNDSSKIIYRGEKVYFYDKSDRLSKPEVRELMENYTKALRFYNKSISMNRWGNISLISGACLTAAGFLSDENLQYQWEDHGTPAHNRYVATITSMITGAAMLITGITLKTTSKIPLKKSVNTYNNTLKSATGMEFKFDFTSNGLRMALIF